MWIAARSGAFLQRRLGVIPTCVLGAVLCQLATLACAGLTELQAFVLVPGFLYTIYHRVSVFEQCNTIMAV